MGKIIFYKWNGMLFVTYQGIRKACYLKNFYDKSFIKSKYTCILKIFWIFLSHVSGFWHNGIAFHSSKNSKMALLLKGPLGGGLNANRAYGIATLYWVPCLREAQCNASCLDPTHWWPMYLACTDMWSLQSYPDRWHHSCRGLNGTRWCPSRNEALHSPSDTHSGRHHLCSHIFPHAHKDCYWLEDTSTNHQDQSTWWGFHKCGLQKWVRLLVLGPGLW